MHRTAALLPLLCASSAVAGGADLVLTLSVNGGPAITLDSEVQPLPPSFFGPGAASFTGSYVDPGGGWQVLWTLTGAPNFDGIAANFRMETGALIQGNVTVTNLADTTDVFRVSAELATNGVPKGAIMTGSVSIGLSSNQSEIMETLPGGAFWTGLIDGTPVREIYPHPYDNFCCGDCLNCQSSAHFGTPLPEPAPGLGSSIAAELEFSLTPGAEGNQGSITYAFAVARLLGDFDADRQVGVTDLLALLANWGCVSETCMADLDGNGEVNDADILVLFDNWGP